MEKEILEKYIEKEFMIQLCINNKKLTQDLLLKIFQINYKKKLIINY